MPRVLRRPQVRIDLLKIWDYIRQRNPDAAEQVLRDIDERFTLLSEFPEMGSQRDEIREGMRLSVYKRFIILYFPIEDGVEIVRVVRGERDLKRVKIAE